MNVYLKPILLARIQPLLYSDFRYLKESFLLFQPNQFPSSWNQFLGFVSWEGTVRVLGAGLWWSAEENEPFQTKAQTMLLRSRRLGG